MSENIGHTIANSTEVNHLISQLVQQVQSLETPINGPRGPRPECMEASRQIVADTEKYRGRAMVFPYIGSGAGHGPYVELEDGSVKLDLINGIGVHILGHSHPRVMAATVRGALSDIVWQGNLQPNRDYSILGKKIVELASRNSRLRYVWLTTCGTMANENALKMARQKHSPARLVVAMKNSFAGRSTMMAEITDNPAYREGLPEYNEVLRVPFYDAKDPRSTEKTLAALKEHVANNEKKIAAFMFEPMLGEGGYKSAPREFFVPLLEFCKERNIAVWVDEVQTFMRTGELFAFETLGFGQYVDLCTIAKTLQNGAVLYTEDYNPRPGLVAGTFSGSSATLSAGLEVLDIMTAGGYFGPNGKIAEIHRSFVGMLNRLNETTCKGMLRDAGGLGLMAAVTPLDGGKDTVTKLLQVMFNNGLMAFSCGRDPYRLRFLIPAVIEPKDIEVAGKIIEKSILEMA